MSVDPLLSITCIRFRPLSLPSRSPSLPRLARSPAELFKNSEIAEEANAEPKILYIAITSDRGLCGGIHSTVSKATRKALDAHPGSALAVIGDKPKAQLSRSAAKDLKITFNQVGKDIPTFGEAAAIADEITTKAGEWDVVKIIYNKYISAISYEATTITVNNSKSLSDARECPVTSSLSCVYTKTDTDSLVLTPLAAGFKAYEQEEDVSKDLAEFSLANAIYTALAEGHAAEQSARRTAMEVSGFTTFLPGNRY